MPLEFGFGQIGHDVVFKQPGGLKVVGTAMSTLIRMDLVFLEDGAGRRLRPEEPGVVAVLFAPMVGARGLRVVVAVRGAFATLADVLKLVLELRHSAAEFRVLSFQFGDPLLKGAHHGQDGGLGIRRHFGPEW
jgi:hypothetical protein